MKTFIVKGFGWSESIEVDESVFNKSSDQAIEAMTLSLSRYIEGSISTPSDHHGVGIMITAYEPHNEKNEYLHHYALSTFVLRNAGYHSLADEMKCWNEGGQV